MGTNAIESITHRPPEPLDFLTPEQQPDEDPEGQRQLLEALHDIRQRINHDQDVLIVITGEPGRGKSTLAIELGAILGHATHRELAINDIQWTAPDYMRRAHQLHETNTNRGHVLILDEGLSGGFSRDAMRGENKAFQKWLSIVRWMNLIHIICAPRRTTLDENIRNDRVTHWIHLDEVGEAWMHQKQEWVYRDSLSWNKIAQFRFPPLNPHDHPLYRRYLNRKNERGLEIAEGFLHEAGAALEKRGDRPGPRKLDVTPQQVAQLVRENKTQTDIAEFFGIAQSTVSSRVAEAREMGLLDE